MFSQLPMRHLSVKERTYRRLLLDAPDPFETHEDIRGHMLRALLIAVTIAKPGARERGAERGTTGAAPERSARPEPGARERGAERGTTGAARQRSGRPEPGARERGAERGTTGAAPERSGRPEPGAHERGAQRSTTGAGPERERGGER